MLYNNMEEERKLNKMQCFQDNNKKYLTFLIHMDEQISKKLKVAGIETRPVKSNGLWCCIILPAILSTYTTIYAVSPLYKATTFISIGLLFYSLLFIMFTSVSSAMLKETIYGGCIASSMVSALLVYIYFGQSFLFSVTFSTLSVFLYRHLLYVAIVQYQKTFTIGEALIVMQGITLYATIIPMSLFCGSVDHDGETTLVHALIYIGLSTMGLIVTALCLLTDEQRNLKILTLTVSAAFLIALIALYFVVGKNFLSKTVYFIIAGNRLKIFISWALLLVITVTVVMSRTKKGEKANTATRKSFHILASLVFMSGILLDVHLMELAAGAGLALIVIMEALRKSQIEPISSALQSAFQVYSDEKDVGAFAMSPLYLYAGLACPLVLVPTHENASLELLSGVLSIGIGDTAASFFGSYYGINKWSGSNRTFEGTVSNIASQILTVHILNYFGLLHGNYILVRAAFAATVSGLVEAHTEQMDNLILPLVTIMTYQAVWVLC